MALGKNMNKYYVSFAANHWQFFKDFFIDDSTLVLITAADYDAAFKRTKEIFQNKWSMLYSENEISSRDILEYWPKGIIQIE